MKILVVVHGFPPRAQGGSEIYAETHARALQREYGDEVVVLTREADSAAPEYRVRTEERDGLRIVWVNNTFREAKSFEETYRNAAIERAAERVIDDVRPDVAHVHHLTCLSTGIVTQLSRRRIPVFFTLHDYWLMCHRGQLLDRDFKVCDGPGERACDRCLGLDAGMGSTSYGAASALRALESHLPAGAVRSLRRAAGSIAGIASNAAQAGNEAEKRLEHMRAVSATVTHFLAPSRHMRDRFIRFGVSADRISLAEYGFDHALFRRAERSASKPLRLGFLGTLMVSKAPHVVLEAVSRLPPGTASVDLFGAYAPYHGDDSYRARLDPLLALDGVRVHGSITHEQVPAALASIDVLVVPSVWPENSPLVIREAFVTGLPVVASRIGGIPEAFDDSRGGLLFEPGDAADLHRALARLIDDPALLPSLRATIPGVRTIQEDVRFARDLYRKSLPTSVSPSASPVAAPAVPSSPPGQTTAIVLNFRTPDDTLLAVRSLLSSRQTIDRILVVNNDSTPGPCGDLAALAPSINCLDTGTNLGFSGGVNFGIRVALAEGARQILLVNSDVIVPPDCLERLQRALAETPRTGIAAPVMLARSDPGRVASLGMSYSSATGRMFHGGFGMATKSLDLSADLVVDGVAGALMLIRREVFDAIGLFDEDYFFTFEDLDFCLRARRAGFLSVVAWRAKAYHQGGRSIGADSPSRLYYAARNHLLMARRGDASGGGIAALSRTSSILALNLAHAVTGARGPLWKRLGAVLRGTRDYARGKFGGE
jgi:GT2 family glycosyltransferase/glycosyltransferase involved in cell wall biosynthesis